MNLKDVSVKKVALNLVMTTMMSATGISFFACSQGHEAGITIQVYGKTYTITKYEIKRDEENKTVVKATGKGLGTIVVENGKMMSFPVKCAFISGGQLYMPNKTSGKTSPFSAETIEFHFNTSDKPETLVFFPEDNPDKKLRINCRPSDDVLPATFQAHGKTYIIEDYVFEKNEQGNTGIVIMGQGLTATVEIDNKQSLPVLCDFIANGQTYEFHRASKSDTDFVIYHFEDWVIPDTLIIYANGDPDNRIVINCKKKNSINN